MNTATTSAGHAFEALGDACRLDLARARERLMAARAHQRVKDSTGNRARVAECRAQIDAILDLYLEAGRTSCSATAVLGPEPLVA
jgi:hypothetical protein